MKSTALFIFASSLAGCVGFDPIENGQGAISESTTLNLRRGVPGEEEWWILNPGDSYVPQNLGDPSWPRPPGDTSPSVSYGPNDHLVAVSWGNYSGRNMAYFATCSTTAQTLTIAGWDLSQQTSVRIVDDPNGSANSWQVMLPAAPVLRRFIFDLEGRTQVGEMMTGQTYTEAHPMDPVVVDDQQEFERLAAVTRVLRPIDPSMGTIEREAEAWDNRAATVKTARDLCPAP